MYVRVAWALTAGLLVGAPLTTAAAAEPDESAASGRSAEEPEDAAELMDRAIALRRGGDDMRALDLLLQAEKRAPNSTRVQVHLAAVYQALGRWEDADRYLSLAVRNPDDEYVQRHQAVLASARRTIDQHIGSLQLSGGPDGTEVWLNGKSIGKLPIEEVVRVEAGIYNLEARHAGYYSVMRSVALAGGALTRESIRLSPELGRPPASAPADVAPEASRGPRWLGWTFAGLAVGAGVGTVVAWSVREDHVDTWNDDSQCLRPGQTRGEVCADERSKGDQAETWMWISGAATAAFAAASVITFALTGEPDTESGVGSVGCGIGSGAVSCSGRF